MIHKGKERPARSGEDTGYPEICSTEEESPRAPQFQRKGKTRTEVKEIDVEILDEN